jgi:hypothetical protein
LFNLEAQNLQPISGIEPNDAIHKWSKDDAALMVTDATPAQARVFRVEVATGKRTLLQKVELNERAGSSELIRLWYAEDSKTYVYNTRRVLGSLYVVEGLE